MIAKFWMVEPCFSIKYGDFVPLWDEFHYGTSREWHETKKRTQARPLKQSLLPFQLCVCVVSGWMRRKVRRRSTPIPTSFLPVAYAVPVPAPAPIALPIKAPLGPPASAPISAPAPAPPPIITALRFLVELPCTT